MVARRSRGVNRAAALLALVVVVCLPCRASGKRLPPPEEISEWGVVEEEEEEAGDPEFSLRFELPEEAVAASIKDLLDGHLGSGTAADVFFEGPAGIRVNLLSGNLVWQGSFLSHGSPQTRLQLVVTYNSWELREEGGESVSGLPPGWTHGFGSRMRPGPWGVVEFVEADGFVHRFYSTSAERGAERDELIEDIVESRRSAPRTPGLPLPSGRRFRRMLEEDDAFLEAMRARFLGGGASPAGVYLGQGRGHQVAFVAADGSTTRVRSDGCTERFGRDGDLLVVEPGAGPALVLTRQAGRIASVELDGGPSLSFEHDGGGQLTRISDKASRELAFDHRRGRMVGLAAPGGSWTFEVDEDGRLDHVRGPQGWARIRYDGDRVSVVEGPAGATTFEFQHSPTSIQTRVNGPAGDVDIHFDLQTRTRTVADAAGVREVGFDRAANRPVSVGGLQLRYDTAGHIVEVSGPGGSLTVETDASDRPVRIVDATGSAFTLQTDDAGRLSRVVDGGGLAVGYRYDSRGQLVRETQGDSLIALHRDGWGEIERVSLGAAEKVYVRRDGAGRLTSVHHGSDLGMRLWWDAAGRLTGLEGPDRWKVDLVHGGALQIADARGRLLVFETDERGLLSSVERTSAPLQLSLDREPGGGVRGLSTSAGWDLKVQRFERRVIALDEDVLGSVRFQYDDHGLARVHVGPTSWAFDREGPSGRTNRITSSAGRDVRMGRGISGRISYLSRGGRTLYAIARDAAGRPTWIDPATGTPMAIRRDRHGRVVQVTSQGEALLELSRDGLGRVVRAGRGDEQWSLSYSLIGLPQHLSSSSGETLEIAQDSAGRTTEVVGPRGGLVDIDWDRAGRPVGFGGARGSLSIEYGSQGVPASVGSSRYQWTSPCVDVVTAASRPRRIALDRVGRVDVAGPADGVLDELSWGSDGALIGWKRGDGRTDASADIFGRIQSASVGPGARLEFAYGVDGLMSRWRMDGDWEKVDRDARGAARSPLPCASLGEASALLCGFGGRPGPVARALFDSSLPPPWADRAAAGAASVIGPPLPRWAVDLQRNHADLGWASAVPAPPGSDLVVPEPLAGNELTVPGLLVLLGFLVDDLAEHRVIVPLPASPQQILCPGVRELRALRHRASIERFEPGRSVVSAEPTGRGVILLPDGALVGHPTPWGAVDDPFQLSQPGLEILGVATVAAAPGAIVAAVAPPVDQDPLAVPLQRALEIGRWVAPTGGAALDERIGGVEETAGAIGMWLASHVQAVVDHRGRLRGLDLGATAVAMWNRAILEQTLAAYVDGEAGGLPRLWLATPGAQPEAGAGLAPGFGAIWPDRTGELRWVRGW